MVPNQQALVILHWKAAFEVFTQDHPWRYGISLDKIAKYQQRSIPILQKIIHGMAPIHNLDPNDCSISPRAGTWNSGFGPSFGLNISGMEKSVQGLFAEVGKRFNQKEIITIAPAHDAEAVGILYRASLPQSLEFTEELAQRTKKCFQQVTERGLGSTSTLHITTAGMIRIQSMEFWGETGGEKEVRDAEVVLGVFQKLFEDYMPLSQLQDLVKRERGYKVKTIKAKDFDNLISRSISSKDN